MVQDCYVPQLKIITFSSNSSKKKAINHSFEIDNDGGAKVDLSKICSTLFCNLDCYVSQVSVTPLKCYKRYYVNI